MAGKYSLTIITHKNQIKEKVDKSNYTYESKKSSPVSFLAREESLNLHVKMVKNMWNMALIALRLFCK